MFKILGAKNRRKNLHKHPGPPFQIREGPGSFSNAQITITFIYSNRYFKFCERCGTFISLGPHEGCVGTNQRIQWQTSQS